MSLVVNWITAFRLSFREKDGGHTGHTRVWLSTVFDLNSYKQISVISSGLHANDWSKFGQNRIQIFVNVHVRTSFRGRSASDECFTFVPEQ